MMRLKRIEKSRESKEDLCSADRELENERLQALDSNVQGMDERIEAFRNLPFIELVLVFVVLQKS